MRKSSPSHHSITGQKQSIERGREEGQWLAKGDCGDMCYFGCDVVFGLHFTTYKSKVTGRERGFVSEKKNNVAELPTVFSFSDTFY